MAELKTKPTGESAEAFLNTLQDEQKREDALALLNLIQRAAGAEPKMWGGSIVGFGDYHYQYESGRENDWFLAGFAPRKQNFALYMTGGWDRFPDLLARLGKHKRGKGCLYINRLNDVDQTVLHELIRKSVEATRSGS